MVTHQCADRLGRPLPWTFWSGSDYPDILDARHGQASADDVLLGVELGASNSGEFGGRAQKMGLLSRRGWRRRKGARNFGDPLVPSYLVGLLLGTLAAVFRNPRRILYFLRKRVVRVAGVEPD